MTTILLLVALSLSGQTQDPPEPGWVTFPARSQSQGQILGSRVLADVESHLWSGHPYKDNDPRAWSHEGTHGVNSSVRNQYRGGTGVWNACYCLGNKACVIAEPRGVTLGAVATYVPTPLRGRSYQLYMQQQRSSWENEPLNVLDEWSAYYNSALTSYELGSDEGDFNNLMEMGVYSLALCAAVDDAVQKRQIRYDHRQLRAFVAWNWKRSMDLWEAASKRPRMFTIPPRSYYDQLARGTDPYVVRFRDWCRGYFGAAWCGRVMRF